MTTQLSQSILEASDNHAKAVPSPENDQTSLSSEQSEDQGATEEVTLYHLVLFQKDEDSINRSLVREVQKCLDTTLTTPKDRTHIDIWLESWGGGRSCLL